MTYFTYTHLNDALIQSIKSYFVIPRDYLVNRVQPDKFLQVTSIRCDYNLFERRLKCKCMFVSKHNLSRVRVVLLLESSDNPFIYVYDD